MMGWINAYAFFIFVGFTALFLGALLFWNERSRRRQIVVMLLFTAVVGSYWQVRPGASNATAEEMAALTAISAGETVPLGQPVLIEVYTNY
jgi:drug/metabolite transporter (DMT)-like permease